jgi:ankyrin repeat protein
MYWSQDIVTFLLFPYILPSLSCEENCWKEKKFRKILEFLLMFLCDIRLGKTRKPLETFVKRTFMPFTTSYNVNLNDDLRFLGNIQKGSTFETIRCWNSEVHFLYISYMLLKKDYNVNIRCDNAIRMASIHGYKDVVSLILAYNNHKYYHYYDEALQGASSNGHTEVVSMLIENKANVNSKKALRDASANDHKDVVSMLIKNGADVHADQDCALRHASTCGSTNAVAVLLANKANPHAYNNYAIQWAAFHGHTSVVVLLLEHKADLHANNNFAIRNTIALGHTSVVALLLEHKANLDSNSNFAVQNAIAFGHTDTVALLLKYGGASSPKPPFLSHSLLDSQT